LSKPAKGFDKVADISLVIVRPERSNNTWLAGFGVSAALVAAAVTAFVALGAFVAFQGWPGGSSSTDRAGHSVYVGNGVLGNVPSRAAAQALGPGPAAVANGALPSPALIAAAGGTPLPLSGGTHGRSHGGSGNGGPGDHSGGVPRTPPPPTIVDELQGTVNGTPVGQTGMLSPVFTLLGGPLGTAGDTVGAVGGLLGGTVGGLLGPTQPASSQPGAGGLLSGLLGHR
jgi:hypothetical protein